MKRKSPSPTTAKISIATFRQIVHGIIEVLHNYSKEARKHPGAEMLICFLQTATQTVSDELGRSGQENNLEPPLNSCLIVKDRCWECIHTGPWALVDLIWRELYGCSTAVMTLTYVLSDTPHKRFPQNIYEIIDDGLLFCGPKSHSLLQTILNETQSSDKNFPSLNFKKPSTDRRRFLPADFLQSHSCGRNLTALFPLNQLPSLFSFKKFMDTGTPVILPGLARSWPAFRKWSLDFEAVDGNGDCAYLRQLAGHRTVPIEVGGSYASDQCEQKLMKLADFFDNMDGKYLAQHTLFDQIPQLRKDIVIPDYCVMHSDFNKEQQLDELDAENVRIHAWIGPKNTISPLHQDPQENILVQLWGAKYIELYPASEKSKIYPYEADEQGRGSHEMGPKSNFLTNTSRIDVEKYDDSPSLQNKYPLFASSKGWRLLLCEGDALYIPKYMWHFVRSIENSISVSFWWD